MANHQGYTVGWICALTTEFVAAQAFLDEEHEGPREVAQNDNNNYALGRIGNHNIVIAVLPDGEYGTAITATVARDMLHSFPNIRIGLLVGIAGGAPGPNQDIRLGDIIVSSRDGGKGGVFQYDFGKTIQNQSFQETGFLDQPPIVLRTADALMRDKLAAEKGILCFEMEAAGLMNHFPCLVIRGIYDYSDSYKNKEWQGFAAMVAAAYAKDLLRQIPPNKVEAERRISEVLSSRNVECNQSHSGDGQIESTVDGMLRSLAFQLYKLEVDSSRELDGLFQSHREGRDQPATKTLLGYLHTMLRGPIKTFLVLDALDESTARAELLQWMKDVISIPELGHVRLIATGRPEAEFQREIPPLIGKDNCLLLNKDAINADIRSYVMARLEQSPEFAKWASFLSVLEQIRNEIGSKPDGMFRWAACQLDSLETCLDREGIEIALKSLPQDLNETYNRILQRIPPERKHKAIRLLQFLVCSERPLTLKEAVDVIAVRIDSRPGYFDPEDRLPCPSEITGFCPSLVSIVQGPHGGEDAVEEVQLAHFSVKEYLLSYQVQGFLHAEASIVITQTCLTYLTSLKKGSVAIIKSQFPLAKYAAKVWMDHTRPAQVSSDIVAEAVSFLENDVLFRLWTRLYQLDWPLVEEPGTTQASCLYFACLGGLTETVKVLLSNNRNVNAQGGRYGTALQAASAEGYKEIVRLLLDKNADINARSGLYGTALYAASYGGHKEIVRLLLDEGADVNTQGGDYGTALQAASAKGHKEIVRLLLTEGADFNMQGGYYGTALQAASARGHKEVVRLLLDKHSKVNAQGGDYNNALQAASFFGHKEIVRLLLDEGADTSALTRPLWQRAPSSLS
ncbi:hypothetical protein FOXG_17298 [Fusarium oxysporum f. sp. lycopersici 4287]|uniref:Nucleoside phosphorylase domain-containing protein n=2 Tax=Fusarium oxysporum TaxID=5507 RepID=A0A0J9WVS9_FUSO4|nr:uncharacterized protein FOXG_17298 [Fusarium oxysporum f. sp. lycopersici 4287]KAJ9412649.1 hypothetical protein QL093DRAFT_2595426 [Fusarium oxysporum]KAJ9414784.1 hypothetical protein QL093DRAFT_2593379 [Fusarium oxysporum]KAJ9424358.1 hypothetical protein QL093DRAFT_2587386 [Fusarium oxysporum]KNB20062.1 hypothetical protein FOXG_17298 [Fusarium oxysporum f. sp. lycopersici 4287]